MQRYRQLMCSVILVGLALLSTGCADERAELELSADRGSLVALDWHPASHQPLVIQGQWQVIWGELVTPEAFDERWQGEYFFVPQRWNDVHKEGMDGALGSATFRLTLLLDERLSGLSVHLISPHSAWRMFANGVWQTSNGVPSLDPEEFQAHYVSRVFPIDGSETEFVLQVSNFAHAYGGPGHPPVVWDAAELDDQLSVLSIYYVLVFGVLTAIVLFHLIIYAADLERLKSSGAHLYLSLLCAVMLIRIGPVIPYFYVNSDSTFFGSMMLTYLTLFLAPGFYVLFFRAAFPDQFPKALSRVIAGGSLALALVVLFFDAYIYTHLRDFAIALNLFVIVFTLAYTAKAAWQGIAGANWVLVPNIAFLGTALHDGWLYTDNSYGFDLTPFGVVLLGLGYSYTLLARLQNTFAEAQSSSRRLADMNVQLEKQVSERTKAFEAAAAQAQAYAAERTQFLAAASHDLRQPLHALGMFNAVLKQQAAGTPLDPLIDKQRASIDNLGDLLKDALDAARTTDGDAQAIMEVIDVATILKDLEVSYGPQARERGVTLEFHASPGGIVTDPAMLKRVLGNLIDNGLKVARRQVQVNARLADTDWHISVEDDGPGIPAELGERMFEPYVQAENATDGYGLGLFVVREFSRRLGGTVAAGSSALGGANIIVRFNGAFESPPVEADATATDTEIALCGLRVLVVDDEPEVLEAAAALLNSWQVEVECARSVASARQRFEREDFDVLVADYHIGHDNGLLMVQSLKAERPELEILMITGVSDPNVLGQIHRAGYPCLQKPIQAAALNAALATCRKGVV